MADSHHDVNIFTPTRPSAEDIEKAKQLPRDACPRRHCWWWPTLSFDWETPVASACRFLTADKPPNWPNAQVPCSRCDPESKVDHYEQRDPHLIEDGFDPDHWRPGEWRRIQARDFSLWLPWDHGTVPGDEVCTLVDHAGERYWCHFVLPAFLVREVTTDQRHYAGGRYYSESGMVVVRDLAEETLLAVIADLINREQLSAALSAVGEE